VRALALAPLVTGAALAAASAAAAHVTVSPAAVTEGVTSRVTLLTPNERPRHATTSLAVELPVEVAIVSADAPPGWRVSHTSRTVTWTGGAIRGEASASFPLTLRGIGPAGAVTLDADQGYEDGATVPWKASLTVLPASGADAPREHPGRALLAAVVGVAVVAVSLVVVHRLRRRPDRDRP
jgi:hypothetical protein